MDLNIRIPLEDAAKSSTLSYKLKLLLQKKSSQMPLASNLLFHSQNKSEGRISYPSMLDSYLIFDVAEIEDRAEFVPETGRAIWSASNGPGSIEIEIDTGLIYIKWLSLIKETRPLLKSSKFEESQLLPRFIYQEQRLALASSIQEDVGVGHIVHILIKHTERSLINSS
jgi:hypothetical protein